MPKIDELATLAKSFGDKLASVKAGISPGPFTWYPYQSLSNFPALDQALTGEARSLLNLARGKPILRRDFGSDFEDTGDELLKGRRLGAQRQLLIRAPPHPASPSHSARISNVFLCCKSAIRLSFTVSRSLHEMAADAGKQNYERQCL